jgi:HEAT repeat protein
VGDAQAIGPLLEVHFADPDWPSLLPPPDDPRYDYVLGMGVEGKYPVREAAGAALERFEDARAVEPLVAALKDKEWFVRAHAAEALGKIADPRALGPLYTAQKDPNSSVRAYAESAYKKTRDRN